MAEKDPNKPVGRGGENTLALLGTLLDVGGKVLLGPDAGNIDLGSPFKLGAAQLANRRQEQNLLKLLKSTPETAPIAEEAEALANNGGLLNVLSGSGGQPQVPQSPVASGILPGEQGGMPTNLPGSPQQPTDVLSALRSPQPQPTEEVNINSDEFLRRAAQLRPDLAEALIINRSRAGMMQDPTIQALRALRIANFETPDERRLKDLKANQIKQQQNAAVREQQNISKEARNRAKITTTEAKDLAEIEDIGRNYRQLQILRAQGAEPSFTKNVLTDFVPGAERILQSTDPQFALLKKQATETQALFIKFLSGVAVSEPEFRRISPTQPRAGDDPELFDQLTQNNIKKTQEAKLIKLDSIANRGGDISQYIDPQDMRDYQLIRRAMQIDLPRALSNPKVQAIRQKLGIDYSLTPDQLQNLGGN